MVTCLLTVTMASNIPYQASILFLLIFQDDITCLTFGFITILVL
ncbi:hypothetical protein SAMN05428947_11155 [Mucilaginibacter sp. OK283]|nr:hypothetical protein SAMN05428947_11155 [Mucilaginibacter sp. OK283]